MKHRPSYPAVIIDGVLDGLGDPRAIRAADMGAGTGISARLLADRGVRVTAVEPNRVMREAAGTHALISWVDASAERTTLEASSHDIVLCAQAFHWFEPSAALAEFRRVLTPQGRVCVMWNHGSPSDPAVRAYYDVVFNASDEARALASSRHYEDPFAHRAEWHSLPVIRAEFVERYDLDALLGRARSASYVPRDGTGWAWVQNSLKQVFDRFASGGTVAMTYQCTLFRAEPRTP